MTDEENWDPNTEIFDIISSDVKLITSIPTMIHKRINMVKISYIINERHHKHTPESLARKWIITLKTAADTIKTKTQLSV